MDILLVLPGAYAESLAARVPIELHAILIVFSGRLGVADGVADADVVPGRLGLPVGEDDRTRSVVVKHANASVLDFVSVIGTSGDQICIPEGLAIDLERYLDQLVEPLCVRPVTQMFFFHCHQFGSMAA